MRKSNNVPEEMEILIPSLAMILMAVAVAFFIMPKLALPILIAASGLVLMIAVYVHWKRFGTMEYERSTWQNTLREHTSFAMIVVVLAAAYGFYALNAGNSSPMPALSTPMMGGGFDEVMKTAVSRVNQLMRKGRISE